jgi:hypothetical protein
MLTGVIVPNARVILYVRYVMWMTRYFTFYVYVIALLSVIYDLAMTDLCNILVGATLLFITNAR